MSDAFLDDDEDDYTIIDDEDLDDLDFIARAKLAAELGELDELVDEDAEDEPSLTPEQVAAYQAELEAKRCAPKVFNHKVTKKTIAVVDTETDPFAFGTIVKPFTLGFDTGDRYVDFWGDDCVEQFFAYLATLDEEFIIYAHNGGKFDFFFFLQHLDAGQTPLVMGGRLVKIHFGKQEFRDSYAIIPQGLGAYQKDKIDYNNFTRDKREAHKAEILAYQKTDCAYTRELIVGFHNLFGDKLTVASGAFSLLHSYSGFERFDNEQQDARFRQYYFGGRNQCFETGILRPRPGRKWKMIDRNSMYPTEMRDQLHPISNRATLQTTITKDTDFACIMARNRGALPMRAEDGSLDFTVPYGKFYATIHEINAGLETGTLEIVRVLHAWAFDRKASFAEYVNRFYDLRLAAKAEGDKILDILYKFCLNSPYGKFALNPRKFKQWLMTDGEVPTPQRSLEHPEGWTLHSSTGDLFIWCRPSPRRRGFYNVATAASITGAARANLLRNLAISTRPIYCDTDSILCEDYRGVLDEPGLGGWKLEATGDMAAIAGKKLYAVFNEGDAIKKASKGVDISPAEIMAVCRGQEVIYQNPVPTFRLGRNLEDMNGRDFLTRRVNRTGIL